MKHQIFIVEDHPAMQSVYTLTINSQPDLVVTGMAASAEEALPAIASSPPDLVLIDVSLPGMSGLDLLKELETQHPNLPALLISGHDKALYLPDAMPNARGYVMKHEGPEAVLASIRQVFEQENEVT